MPNDPLDVLLGYLTNPAKFFCHLKGKTALWSGNSLPSQIEVVVNCSYCLLLPLQGLLQACRHRDVGTNHKSESSAPKTQLHYVSALKLENKNVILFSNYHSQVVFPFSFFKEKTILKVTQ